MTKQQERVMELVCKGMSNRAIANEMFVTEGTVKFHLGNIFKEKKVKSRQELIVQCLNAQKVSP